MPPPPGRIDASFLVFFALAATVPFTVLTTVVPAAYAGGDVLFVPLVFLAAGLTLVLSGVGFAAMAGRAPVAGALSSFIARGLGRPIGVGAGWLAVLSYQAIQIGLYGALGAAAAPLLADGFGVSPPWWAVAAGAWLLVAVCGLLRVEATASLLGLLVLAEAAVIVGFGAANLLHPADGRITWDTLTPGSLGVVDRPALGVLLVVAAMAFIGFETATAYAEEVIRPRRSIARAAVLAVVLLTLLFAASAWALSVAIGPDRVAELAAGRGPELVFDLAAARLAPWAVTLGRVLLLTGLLAALISLHHTIARYTAALARERVLPPRLGRAVPASLAQSLLTAAALAGVFVAGWDPLAQTFGWLTRAGALGILLLLPVASVAALLHLNRVPGREKAGRRFVAPALSTVLLGALVYLAFANLPAVLGVPAGHPLVFGMPGALAVTLLLGISYGFVVKAVSPVTYAGIGLGGAAVVVTPAVPAQRAPGAHRPERVRR